MLLERTLLVKRSKVPKIFFGWWIVLASGFLTFWGQGFGHFGFSALFKPIASELGFSRAATSVAPSISRLEGGLLSPVVGWVTDRFGPRWIAFSGTFLVGLSLILMNFVNSLWAFYLVWGILLGTGISVGFGLTLDRTITNWFVKKRGRAVSIKWGFYALAGILLVPLVGWLVSMQGWRLTCAIAGLVTWIIGLPLVWFFIKQRRPEYYGLLPDGATTKETADISQVIDRGVKYATEAEEVEFTLRQTMRTSAYWLLLLAQCGFAMIPPVLTIHAVPFLTDMGIEPLKAAVVSGIMALSTIPGTLIGGFVADRVRKQRLRFLIGGAYFVEIIGFTSFLLNPTITMAYALFTLGHFGASIIAPLNNILTARYFGRKAFGSIRGMSMMFMLPASIVAPIYAGWGYDTTGNYIIVLFACAVSVTLSTIIISLASPPKPPAQVTDIHKIV
ncbi:MFS transporter [Chloroflexota bacterium]